MSVPFTELIKYIKRNNYKDSLTDARIFTALFGWIDLCYGKKRKSSDWDPSQVSKILNRKVTMPGRLCNTFDKECFISDFLDNAYDNLSILVDMDSLCEDLFEYIGRKDSMLSTEEKDIYTSKYEEGCDVFFSYILKQSLLEFCSSSRKKNFSNISVLGYKDGQIIPHAYMYSLNDFVNCELEKYKNEIMNTINDISLIPVNKSEKFDDIRLGELYGEPFSYNDIVFRDGENVLINSTVYHGVIGFIEENNITLNDDFYILRGYVEFEREEIDCLDVTYSKKMNYKRNLLFSLGSLVKNYEEYCYFLNVSKLNYCTNLLIENNTEFDFKDVDVYIKYTKSTSWRKCYYHFDERKKTADFFFDIYDNFFSQRNDMNILENNSFISYDHAETELMKQDDQPSSLLANVFLRQLNGYEFANDEKFDVLKCHFDRIQANSRIWLPSSILFRDIPKEMVVEVKLLDGQKLFEQPIEIVTEKNNYA